MTRARSLIGVLAFVVLAACVRRGSPEAPEASAPVPQPTPPVARDAAPDVTDARSDATDAASVVPARHHAGKAAQPGGGGGGGAGFKVTGSLPRGEAEKVVRAGSAKVRACNPNLSGRVVFRLTVDERGRVTLGEVVTSTLGGGDPEMCMVRAARDFKFPPAPGESTVSFQMTFGRPR